MAVPSVWLRVLISLDTTLYGRNWLKGNILFPVLQLHSQTAAGLFAVTRWQVVSSPCSGPVLYKNALTRTIVVTAQRPRRHPSCMMMKKARWTNADKDWPNLRAWLFGPASQRPASYQRLIPRTRKCRWHTSGTVATPSVCQHQYHRWVKHWWYFFSTNSARLLYQLLRVLGNTPDKTRHTFYAHNSTDSFGFWSVCVCCFCGVVESSSANNVLFIILASTQQDTLDIRFKLFRFINICCHCPCLFYIYKGG